MGYKFICVFHAVCVFITKTFGSAKKNSSAKSSFRNISCHLFDQTRRETHTTLLNTNSLKIIVFENRIYFYTMCIRLHRKTSKYIKNRYVFDRF